METNPRTPGQQLDLEIANLKKGGASSADIEKFIGMSSGKKPDGIFPHAAPKFRALYNGGAKAGQPVQNAFVLVPEKKLRDCVAVRYYADLCRDDGDTALADDLHAWCDSIEAGMEADADVAIEAEFTEEDADDV